eukprot:5671721-Pleurochrysis_carterae.AAC.1
MHGDMISGLGIKHPPLNCACVSAHAEAAPSGGRNSSGGQCPARGGCCCGGGGGVARAGGACSHERSRSSPQQSSRFALSQPSSWQMACAHARRTRKAAARAKVSAA